jgi:hypothetical protein
MIITLQLTETVSPMLKGLIKRSGNLSPAMQRIKKEVFTPLAFSAWSRSGLHRRSGALQDAITPFAGKFSSGVGLRAGKGRRDKGLVFAKAHAHTFGRKKWSSKRAIFRRGLRLSSKGIHKWSNKILDSWRTVRSPWGDIPARPFIPNESDIKIHETRIKAIIEEYLNAQAS